MLPNQIALSTTQTHSPQLFRIHSLRRANTFPLQISRIIGYHVWRQWWAVGIDVEDDVGVLRFKRVVTFEDFDFPNEFRVAQLPLVLE